MLDQHDYFPFSALVGQGEMKKGLLLSVVNPRLNGILIRGEKGTAKSTAVRSLAALLPEINVVEDCPYSCDPNDETTLCEKCRRRLAAGETLPRAGRKMRVIDLPVAATEDRVAGTLDLEQAIKKGEKHFEPGVLARANRGILYVDEVNLLDDHIVDILLDSAAMGVNVVEREGVSFVHPANFILVGTMNPEEGELRPQLLDRFGLCVSVTGLADLTLRVELIKRQSAYEANPEQFRQTWQVEEEKIRAQIEAAKTLLTQVTIDDTMLFLIAQIALEMGVDGHRADLVLMKAAKTMAAMQGRTEVREEDIQLSAPLALLHRTRRHPFQNMELDHKKLEQVWKITQQETQGASL